MIFNNKFSNLDQNLPLILDISSKNNRVDQFEYLNAMKTFNPSKNLIKIEKNYFNFKSIKTIITNDSISIIKYIENPCYFSGYVDEIKKMKGTGNSQKCYQFLDKIFNGNKTSCIGQNCEKNKKNQTSVNLL